MSYEPLKEIFTLVQKEINARNKDGETALMWAAWIGDKDVVEALLDKGADVNARNKDGETALIWAAWKNHKGVMEALLDKGADANARDENGNTLLVWVARYDHKVVVAALEKAEKITPERVLNFIREMPAPSVAGL